MWLLGRCEWRCLVTVGSCYVHKKIQSDASPRDIAQSWRELNANMLLAPWVVRRSACYLIKMFYVCVLGRIGFHLHRLFHHVAAGAGPDYMTKHSRRRKARTVFSDQQLHGLEKRFDVQKYLSTPERIELASQLSLSETQVITNL